uniref:Uncharacterized protein n=1 Tax=Ursus americanus TaxID=9643 RepID=A0A452RIE6_URSAM
GRIFSPLLETSLNSAISVLSPGYRHGEGYHFCDSHTSVCLRRKRNCLARMPGVCPGRSFCCIRRQ